MLNNNNFEVEKSFAVQIIIIIIMHINSIHLGATHISHVCRCTDWECA